MSDLSTQRRDNMKVRRLVYMGIISALIIVLQFVSNISQAFLPVAITLTLVPMLVGVALCGRWSGAIFGAVFAVATFVTGAAAGFWVLNPFGTIVTVVLKSVLAGFLAGLVYGLLEKVNKYVAIIVAGVVAPVVNTAIFVGGCYLFFYNDIVAAATTAGQNVFVFIITGYVGINFFVELGLNILLAPTILRIINIKKS